MVQTRRGTQVSGASHVKRARTARTAKPIEIDPELLAIAELDLEPLALDPELLARAALKDEAIANLPPQFDVVPDDADFEADHCEFQTKIFPLYCSKLLVHTCIHCGYAESCPDCAGTGLCDGSTCERCMMGICSEAKRDYRPCPNRQTRQTDQTDDVDLTEDEDDV